MRAKDGVGAYGERVAVHYLQQLGLIVLERNWRCAEGELDIVALDGQTLVFCEVKTRRSDRYGTPAEAVVAAKIRRLRRLAARWLRETTRNPSPVELDLRFDVVSVWPQRSGRARVEHLPGAF